MVYQLSYELKTPDKDYGPLYSYLENDLGTSAKHVLRDSWWIAVDQELDVNPRIYFNFEREPTIENGKYLVGIIGKHI